MHDLYITVINRCGRTHAGQTSLLLKDVNHRDGDGKTCASEAGVLLLIGVELN